MGYKEEMAVFARRLGLQTLGELSLKELAECIKSRPEPTARRIELYAFMKWLNDHLLEVNSSDEESFSREIATWCQFVNKAGFASDNVVGTFEEWLEEHRQVEPLSGRRLDMAELEIRKFYGLPIETPHGLVPASEYFQSSPRAEESFQRVFPVNEASVAPPVEDFGHIHPDRLKLSTYGDSNPEKDEVIDLDEWRRPIVDISSDEDAKPKANNDLSFLTGSNRMVFGVDETNSTTELQEKRKNKTRSKRSGPTLAQGKKKNKSTCGRCSIPGHYHMQCPTNLDPTFDKNPPDDYKCNLCGTCGDHYATVCKRNTQPTSLTQQRKRYAEQKRKFHSRTGRSTSPLREPVETRPTRRERSPHREPKDRHHYDRKSSPYRKSETRHHGDRDKPRERRRSRERYGRRDRSRSRSQSPPRHALRRRDSHRANMEYGLKHSSPEPSFREPELSSPFHSGGLDHDDFFKRIPDAPYRPLFSRPADIKIRGRGSSFYYDDDQKGSIPTSAYGIDDLMSRKRRRSQEPAPHHDGYVEGQTVDRGFLLTELTDLIATTTVSPRAQAPMKNRLPEMFKNDLRQSSWFWDLGPTNNTTLIKREPVPDVVREPSPPVELGVTEKRLNDHRTTQYHPIVLELFKNQKNVWLHKIDKAKRVQASSFFWDKDPEENDVDVSADPNVAVVPGSARDTAMTEAEPVATPIDEAITVAAVNIEAKPDAMLTDGGQHSDSTSAVDVVMENPMTMQILYRDEDEVTTHQPDGDSRVGFKPAIDAIMEDPEPLDVSEAVDVVQQIDVAAIVDEIIAEEAAKTASGAVEQEPPTVRLATISEMPDAPDIVNVASDQIADVVRDANAEQATTADVPVETASVESADIICESVPEQATIADDCDNATSRKDTQVDGDCVSHDTVIKDVIYVKTDPEPAETETSRPEEHADMTVSEGSQVQ